MPSLTVVQRPQHRCGMAFQPSSPPKGPFVLVPLYIYPAADSWQPFFSAAEAHRDLDFLVVVNPNNGPGSSPLPDSNYIDNLARLSCLPNTTILGYVYCGYGSRPLAELEKDIGVYRGWTDQCARSEPRPQGTSSPLVRIDGIFFDEAPATGEHVDYMATISDFTRCVLQTAERDRPQQPLVILNPGVFADPVFYLSADFVVVFENAAAEWGSEYVRANLAALPSELCKRSVAIAHSETCIEKQMKFSVDAVIASGLAGHFATATSGYNQFCPNWGAYVRHADEFLRRGGWECYGTNMVRTGPH